MKTAIGRLRTIGMIEGVSFLLLLGVAMPMKYLAGQPLAVKVVGWLHGVLFVAFCYALMRAKVEHDWGVKQTAIPFIASLIPFGPFVIDKRLKALEDDAA